jgi:Protein of unknown function (DUF1416)
MPRLSGTIDDGAGSFVQLRDAEGDFVGEVRADEEGHFVFYAIPGRWRVICLTPGRNRRQQEVELGSDDLDVRLSA